MNIFFLDCDLRKNAGYYYNRHVIKIILEITQMIYAIAAHNEWDVVTDNPFSPYKPTHVRHPMTIWIGHSATNLDFAFRIGFSLCEEYTRRYNKTHRCQYHLEFLQKCFHISGKITPTMYSETTVVRPLCKKSRIQIPLCMPEEFHCETGIDSYRKYYTAKSHVRTPLENKIEFV